MTGLPLPRLREKKQEHLLEKRHCINNHKISKPFPHGLLQKENNNKFLSLCTTLLLEVLILWDGAILHFLCWNIATPTAYITKPVYNKMMFFALVMINALYYWAALRATSNQEMSHVYLKKNRQNGGRSSLKSLHVPSLLQCDWFFAGRGRVISGLLADRFGSQFRMNTNLLCGVRAIFVRPWNQNMQTKQKQQTNRNRTIWLVYRTIQTRVAFGWLSRRSGEKNFMPENFLEIIHYFTLTS